MIRILGCGISGLSAGINLSLDGENVKIYEKKEGIGGFFSQAHIQAVRNYRNFFKEDVIKFFKKECRLDIKKCYHPIYKLRRYGPTGGSYLSMNGNKPILYSIMRGKISYSLDNELLTQARKNGVKVVFGSKEKKEHCEVIATGPQYRDFQGYGVTYSDEGQVIADEAKMFFNNDFAPRGYGYILPFGKKYVTCAVFINSKYANQNIKRYYENFIEYLDRIKVNVEGKIVSVDSGFGHYNLHINFLANGKKYVGVAAGLLTADYGLATKNALLSGYLAAKSITKGLSYNELIKKSIYPELSRSYLKRYLINTYTNAKLSKKFSEEIKKYKNEPKNVNSFAFDNNLVNNIARVTSTVRRYKYKL
jgi:flavin-dependent dehydrogenase